MRMRKKYISSLKILYITNASDILIYDSKFIEDHISCNPHKCCVVDFSIFNSNISSVGLNFSSPNC